MSVPKRFKTKTQLVNSRLVGKVFTKSNQIYILDKYSVFIHPTKTKRINHNNLSYVIKK